MEGASFLRYLCCCGIVLWSALAVGGVEWRAPDSSSAVPSFRGQDARGREKVAVGDFLVATRNLPDPNFAGAVILLIHLDERSAMGLIINRQTKIPLSRALRQLGEASARADPLYFGGPVDPGGLLALVRSQTTPGEARRVFADVYLISTTALLKKTLAAGAKASTFRAYLGYSGWSAGQLRREIELGAWHILRADADSLFDSEPESVWPRLIRRAEAPFATLRPGVHNDSERTGSHGSSGTRADARAALKTGSG